MTDIEKMAAKLKAASKRSGKTYGKLAEEVYVGPQSLNGYLNGHRPIPSDTFARLCKALQISPNVVMGWDEDTRSEAEIEREWQEDTCRLALQKFGQENQIRMVFEECAELQKELCKHLRGEPNRKYVIEEIADVEIMLEQMVQLFHCRAAVDDVRREKLKRLRERMNHKA